MSNKVRKNFATGFEKMIKKFIFIDQDYFNLGKIFDTHFRAGGK